MKLTRQQYNDLRALLDSAEVEDERREYFPLSKEGSRTLGSAGNIGDIVVNQCEPRGYLFDSEEDAKAADDQRLALVRVIRRKQELERELNAKPVRLFDSSQFKHFPLVVSSGSVCVASGPNFFSSHTMWLTTHEAVWKVLIEEMEQDIRLAKGWIE